MLTDLRKPFQREPRDSRVFDHTIFAYFVANVVSRSLAAGRCQLFAQNSNDVTVHDTAARRPSLESPLNNLNQVPSPRVVGLYLHPLQTRSRNVVQCVLARLRSGRQSASKLACMRGLRGQEPLQIHGARFLLAQPPVQLRVYSRLLHTRSFNQSSLSSKPDIVIVD